MKHKLITTILMMVIITTTVIGGEIENLNYKDKWLWTDKSREVNDNDVYVNADALQHMSLQAIKDYIDKEDLNERKHLSFKDRWYYNKVMSNEEKWSQDYNGVGMDDEDLGRYMTGDKNFFVFNRVPFIDYLLNIVNTMIQNEAEKIHQRIDMIEAQLNNEENILKEACMIKARRLNKEVECDDYNCTAVYCSKKND